MRVPVAPPASPVAITGCAERLEHARDVDALAARHRRLLDGAVAAAEPEVRHRERLVDRRVERDGDDHAASGSSRARRRPRRTARAAPRQQDRTAQHDATASRSAIGLREPVLGALRRGRPPGRRPRRPAARVATRLPSGEHLDARRAAGRARIGPVDLVRRRATAATCAVPAAAHDRGATVRAGHELELGAAAVADRARAERPRPRATGADALVARERPAQQRERVGVARGVARRRRARRETSLTPLRRPSRPARSRPAACGRS